MCERFKCTRRDISISRPTWQQYIRQFRRPSNIRLRPEATRPNPTLTGQPLASCNLNLYPHRSWTVLRTIPNFAQDRRPLRSLMLHRRRRCGWCCMAWLNVNSGSLKGENVAPDYRYSCCVVWGAACILYPLPEKASTGASTPLRWLLRVIIVSVMVSRSVRSRFTTYIRSSRRSCAGLTPYQPQQSLCHCDHKGYTTHRASRAHNQEPT